MWLEGEYNDGGVFSADSQPASSRDRENGREKASEKHSGQKKREMLTVESTDGGAAVIKSVFTISLKQMPALADSVAGSRSIPACVKKALRSKINTLVVKIGAWLHVWV